MRQDFDTLDVLRLEVEDDTAGEFNLHPNPSGDLGGYGYVTPLDNTVLITSDPGDPKRLGYHVLVAGASHFETEPIPCLPGQWAGGSMLTENTTANQVGLILRFEFLNAAGAVIAQGAAVHKLADGTQHNVTPAQAPALTESVRLRCELRRTNNTANPAINDWAEFWNVTITLTATDPGIVDYIENSWIAITGNASQLTINREPLDVSPLTAIITDADLDPAQEDTLRPGRQCRIVVAPQLPVDMLIDVPHSSTLGDVITDSFDPAATSRVIIFGAGAAGSNAEAGGPGELPVTPGIEYLFTGSMRGPARTCSLTLMWFNASNVLISQHDSAGYVMGPNYTFTDQIIATAPAGAARAVARFNVDAGAAGETTHVAGPYYEGSAEATPAFFGEYVAPGDFPEPLYTATIRGAKVSYDLRKPAAKRARIELTATDNATPLANVPRPEGVATIPELQHVLEGAGVPWNLNGKNYLTGKVTTVVATNENAKALDQLGLTRDSTLGYAWVDRRNIVNVFDANLVETDLAATLTEDDYTAVDIDYDTDRCINTVLIKFVRTNPDTGETEEVPYGPYIDAASVKEWGAHSSTFTIQWEDEDPIAIDAFADAILAANATPAVRINSVTIPITTLEDLTPVLGDRRALIELYDLVRLVNVEAGIDESMRVVGVRHTISAKRWTTELQFYRDGGVASPTQAPTPPATTAKTLGQLLRPIGEITMFWGLSISVPAGWLICNGAGFDPDEYPDLSAHLGGINVTPNFNDRVPVGTSVAKPNGVAGGAQLKSIAHTHSTPNHTHVTGGPSANVTGLQGGGGGSAANTVHTHSIASSGGGTTGAASVTTVDVEQPFLALYFIIRAK